MRGKRLISGGLRVETARAIEEPLLWVPDAIAGAHGAARSRSGVDLLELIGSLTEIEVATH